MFIWEWGFIFLTDTFVLDLNPMRLIYCIEIQVMFEAVTSSLILKLPYLLNRVDSIVALLTQVVLVWDIAEYCEIFSKIFLHVYIYSTTRGLGK